MAFFIHRRNIQQSADAEEIYLQARHVFSSQIIFLTVGMLLKVSGFTNQYELERPGGMDHKNGPSSRYWISLRPSARSSDMVAGGRIAMQFLKVAYSFVVSVVHHGIPKLDRYHTEHAEIESTAGMSGI